MTKKIKKQFQFKNNGINSAMLYSIYIVRYLYSINIMSPDQPSFLNHFKAHFVNFKPLSRCYILVLY